MTSWASQNDALEDGLDDPIRVEWYGDRHAERLPDLLVLSQEDLEDDSVDAVVAPVDHHHLDRPSWLAIAVHPPLALLVARGVPGQVVVHHGGEVVLEVDALAEAVCAHQYPLVGRAKAFYTRFSIGRREESCHGFNGDSSECFPEMVGHVLGGGDKAAKDDRMVAFSHETAHDSSDLLELCVFRGGERLGLPGHV